MEETLDGLAVDVGDEVTRSEAGVEGRGTLVDLHDQVVDRVEVGVAEVDPDGPDGEPETPWTASHNDRSV